MHGVSIEVTQNGEIRLLAELDSGKAFLGSNQFPWLAREWSIGPENLVPRRNLLLGIAFVERFNPYQRRRLGGMPCNVAGPGRDAADGDVLLKRQMGHRVDSL